MAFDTLLLSKKRTYTKNEAARFYDPQKAKMKWS